MIVFKTNNKTRILFFFCVCVFHAGSRSYPASCFHSDSHHARGLPGSFSGTSQVQSQRDASGIHIRCHLSSLSEGRVNSLIHLFNTQEWCYECGYEGFNGLMVFVLQAFNFIFIHHQQQVICECCYSVSEDTLNCKRANDIRQLKME